MPDRADDPLAVAIQAFCPPSWSQDHADANLCFARGLAGQLAAVGFHPPPERPVRLLDLGCGDCRWLPAFKAVLGKHTEIHGVDRSSAVLAEARAAFSARTGLRLYRGEAGRLGTVRALPRAFDLAVIAHQQAAVHPEAFARAFGQALARVTPGGPVVVTSYTAAEEACFRHAIEVPPGVTMLRFEDPDAFVYDPSGPAWQAPEVFHATYLTFVRRPL